MPGLSEHDQCIISHVIILHHWTIDLSKNLKPVSVLTIFLFTASRWFSRRNAPPNDVNLSGTQFGEIGDHVIDSNQWISLTSQTTRGQGLGQRQSGSCRKYRHELACQSTQVALSPVDFWLFSVKRRFFKADSNSSLDLNGRTLGRTFFGDSVVVVVVELADSSSGCSSFSGASSAPSTYSSSWKFTNRSLI